MTRARFEGWRRHLVGVLLICLAFGVASSSDGSADAALPVTELKGQGSWGAYRELLTWQNDLAGAKSPVDLGYTRNGSLLGREGLLTKKADFVISGVPFTAAELARVEGGASGLIDAPIQVSSLAFLLQRPVPDGFTALELLCDPNDPEIPDPEACVVRHPYTDPVKVPNANLAAMVFRYAGSGALPMSSWNHPGVLNAMGVDNFTTPPLAGPAPVNRSEADEMNYFMQQFAARVAPAVWSGLKASDQQIKWDPITERLPRQAGASRSGVEQQSQQLALGGGDPSTGTISNFTAGVVAPVPASAIRSVKDTFPQAKVEFIQVQNANGEWVAPTAQAITRAAAAGGDVPLFALTNKVAGAYPLVWIEHLYAPAKGLSLEKTEALAAAIRYIATAGQDAAPPVGEGRLPEPLVKQALAAADKLVHSNCVGKVVENDDPGPYAPDLPAIKAIGTMAHCTSEPKDVAAPPPAGNGSFDGSGGSSGTFDTSSSPTAETAAATTEPATEGDSNEKRPAAAVLAATKLPLPFPASSSGLDRLATLLLGAGLYFLLRRPVGRLLTRAAK